MGPRQIRIRAAAVVALVALVLVVLMQHGSSVDLLKGSPPPAPPAATVTTARLVHGTWDRLPTAPIPARLRAAALWTGQVMFVWGGVSTTGTPLGDGAAYDPSTRSWTRLPRAPIGPRQEPAAVLAGHQVFLWGGNADTVTTDQPLDGASYDLDTRSWSRLPDGPRDPYSWARAFWTGTKVVLLSAAFNTDPAMIRVHAYDPARRQWSTLPSMTLPKTQRLEAMSAASTGTQLWVWPHWMRVVDNAPSTYSSEAGVDGAVFDLATATWHPKSLTPKLNAVPDPLWTGGELLIPYRDLWCPGCLRPWSPMQPGLRIDPTTDAVTALPHGPVSDLGPQYLWTGTDMLAFNTGTMTSGLGPKAANHYPGEAAAWDLASNQWRPLPPAPLAGEEPVAVWAGDRLLIWGVMYDPRQTADRKDAGLEYLPHP